MGPFTAKQALIFAAVLYISLLLAPFDYSFFKTTSLDHYQPEDPGPGNCQPHSYCFTNHTEYILVIGIHLGMKYLRVGIIQNGAFKIIRAEKGRSVVPSVITPTGDGKNLVGFEAQEQAPKKPISTTYDLR